MPEKISRRSFLKLAAGTMILSACAPVAYKAGQFEPYVVPPEEELPGDPTWYASTCRMCPAGCGILVKLVNGRAKKIEGNPQHPLNRGKLCARGQAGLQVLYNPDRLKNAVAQPGGRGSRSFQPLQWQDALNSLLDNIESTDASKIAFLGGLMPDHLYYLVSRWLEAQGAPPPIMYDLFTALDGRGTSAKVSEILFDSSSLPVYDIANANVVYSFGANFLENWMSPVGQNDAYGKFRQEQTGGRGFLVQFEPRMSATGAVADEWVPIRPGTEGLVALALGRIIVEGGSFSPEEAALYRGVEVEPLATASGLTIEELYRFAGILVDAERPVAIPGGVPAGHTNGFNAHLAVQALNLLLRQIGQTGGVYLTPPSPAETLPAAPPPNSFADVEALIERMKEGGVELLFVYGANPVFELPESAGFTQALEKVPNVISFSSFVDETAVQADLILPEDTYLESWGYQVVSPGSDRPAVSGQQAIVKRLYDTRSTADVILALAHAMGGNVAAALPWEDEMSFLEEATSTLFGSSLSPYQVRTPGEFWATWRQYGGWWADRQLLVEPVPSGFTGKVLPASGPQFTGDALEFPYVLYPYPNLGLSDGRGANLPWLQEMPDPMTTASWDTWVELNPETAEILGVDNNDIVKVVSPHGELEAPVVVYPAIRPDVIAIPVGQGHTDFGRYAAGRGSNPINLLAPVKDEQSGALAWGASRVRIEKTGKTYTLARLESLDGEGRETTR